MDEFENEDTMLTETEPTKGRRLPSLKRPDWKRPNWLSRRMLIGLAVVLVIGLVLIGRSIHHHINSADQTVKHPEGSSQTKQTASSPASKSPSQNQSTNSAKPTQIVDTGPGETLAIFAGSSVLAAGAHYVLRTKRQS